MLKKSEKVKLLKVSGTCRKVSIYAGKFRFLPGSFFAGKFSPESFAAKMEYLQWQFKVMLF
jgi:hypothetical protein